MSIKPCVLVPPPIHLLQPVYECPPVIINIISNSQCSNVQCLFQLKSIPFVSTIILSLNLQKCSFVSKQCIPQCIVVFSVTSKQVQQSPFQVLFLFCILVSYVPLSHLCSHQALCSLSVLHGSWYFCSCGCCTNQSSPNLYNLCYYYYYH